MLEYFRQGAQSKFAKIILALLAVPFALWGVDSYTRSGGSGDSVATVAGQKITALEFNGAIKNAADQMRIRSQGTLDPGITENPQFRQMVLDGLIDQRVILADAMQSGFIVSKKNATERIVDIPAFQVDGKFSEPRFEAAARQQGFTPAAFFAAIQQSFITQTYQEGIAGTPVISNASVDAIIRSFEQVREVSVANLLPEQFSAQVKVDEATIKSYYDSHKQDFTVPDQVKLEYLVLSAEELATQIAVPDEEIKKFYDDHLTSFKQMPGEAEKKAAKEKARGILTQIKANPASFSDLAAKQSQDPGSANKGGDLGFLSRGMVVKPLEDAVFEMKQDEVRGPIESEFGYHIVKVTEIRGEERKASHILITPEASDKPKPIAEVRPEIVGELQKQKAGKKFTEVAEPFSNMVYEQSGSLKPAADEYKLSIKQSGWVTRKGGSEPALNNEKLLQSVFGDEVLKNKRNTEAVEVAPNVLVAARVLEFKPSALRPLTEVAEGIRAKLIREEAGKLASKQGKEQLEQIKQGKVLSDLKWSDVQKVSREQPGTLTMPVLEAVFKATVKPLPAYVGVDNPRGGYSLIRVSKVTDGIPTEESKKRYAGELKRLVAQTEFKALTESLRASASVKVSRDALKKDESGK